MIAGVSKSLFALALASTGVCAAQEASPPQLECAAAVLIDPETRQVLYEHSADEVRPVASLTKMMTALLVVERGDLEREIVVSEQAAAVGETTMHLTAGERIKLHDLLIGALLPSANDAAWACAEATAGSVEAFIELMQRRAAELGMTRTVFRNPHGLHEDEHVSTARDMAILAVEFMSHAELRDIVAMQEATVPWPGRPGERRLVNRNQLLKRWDACDGIKTGYTRQAGRCLAASAFVDGWRLIAVVLGAEDAWTEGQKLLQWGFASYYKVALIARGVTRARLQVRGGVTDTVQAQAARDVIAVLPRSQRPPEPTLVEGVCTAPVTVGEVVGRLGVTMPDGSTRTVELIAVQEVARSPWAMITGEPWALGALAAVLALAVGVLAHGAIAEAAGAGRRR
ncbi:MAG: D-alanyl-D-alanine carboxypeptidase family protein [Armatimonadota bacterium]